MLQEGQLRSRQTQPVLVSTRSLPFIGSLALKVASIEASSLQVEHSVKLRAYAQLFGAAIWQARIGAIVVVRGLLSAVRASGILLLLLSSSGKHFLVLVELTHGEGAVGSALEA